MLLAQTPPSKRLPQALQCDPQPPRSTRLSVKDEAFRKGRPNTSKRGDEFSQINRIENFLPPFLSTALQQLSLAPRQPPAAREPFEASE